MTFFQMAILASAVMIAPNLSEGRRLFLAGLWLLMAIVVFVCEMIG